MVRWVSSGRRLPAGAPRGWSSRPAGPSVSNFVSRRTGCAWRRRPGRRSRRRAGRCGARRRARANAARRSGARRCRRGAGRGVGRGRAAAGGAAPGRRVGGARRSAGPVGRGPGPGLRAAAVPRTGRGWGTGWTYALLSCGGAREGEGRIPEPISSDQAAIISARRTLPYLDVEEADTRRCRLASSRRGCSMPGAGTRWWFEPWVCHLMIFTPGNRSFELSDTFFSHTR